MWDVKNGAASDLVSPRLVLRALDSHFLTLCLLAEYQPAASYLMGHLPDDWFAKWQLMAMRLKDLQQDPGYLPWGLRAILARDSGEMIGHIGFHTRPNPDYLAALGTHGVELGYEIYPRWRRQGIAAEALEAMLQFARQQGVSRFILSISPDNQASTALARSFGFQQFGEQVDEEDGLELLYRLDAEQLIAPIAD
jgi:[ribosomal protein S5]-alanine N-acetyltransferase